LGGKVLARIETYARERFAAIALRISGSTRAFSHRFLCLNVHSPMRREIVHARTDDLVIVPAQRSRGRSALWVFVFALGLSTIVTFPSAASARRHAKHRARSSSSTACAGADARVGHASPKLLRSAVVCLVNQQRAQHHLPPLLASPLLNRSAQGWTNVMVSSDQFTHGTNFASRISAAGYVWRSAGENIATGFATPRTVVHAWMGSTGHCQNSLNPSDRNIGTGLSNRAVKGFASGPGTWTQDFALGMHSSPPSGNTGPMDGCPY
jgi:uncharacterized protein YkwD